MAYSKKGRKAAAGAKKALKRAVSRAKTAVKSAVSKGVKRLEKVASKARAKATTTRETARLRVAKASQKPLKEPKFAKADAPIVRGKSARRAGQPLLGTRKRPRKGSPRIIGGVNL